MELGSVFDLIKSLGLRYTFKFNIYNLKLI